MISCTEFIPLYSEIGYIVFFALVGFDALSGIWNLGSIRVDLNWVATPEATTPKLIIDNALLRLITGLFVLLDIEFNSLFRINSSISGFEYLFKDLVPIIITNITSSYLIYRIGSLPNYI